jgi:Tol biopolymer transport system component
MNADGSGQTQVFNENPTIEELRATSDGKYFVFNGEVNGNYQLFRSKTDGSEPKQLTFADDLFISDSVPSPDGSSIVYTSIDQGASTLRRISIDGGESSRVEGAGVGAFTPHFSPNGKYISYVDNSSMPIRLVVWETDNGNCRYFDVVEFAALYAGAIWTPDGRSLAYFAGDNKAMNVWTQPIEGGPPQQLTDFTTGRIHRIAYSADGKRLYLARGFTVNDALLAKGFAPGL